MRLFVAIPVPEVVKEKVQKIQSDFSTSVTKNKHIHLTLKFLGDVDDGQVELIKQKLSDVEFNSFKFKLDKVGFFPAESHFRVLWIGVSPEEDVVALQKQIDLALSDLFLVDKKFKPHITFARVKDFNAKDDIKKLTSKIKVPGEFVKVSEFQLIQSTLGRKPTYTVLQVFPAKDSI